MSETYHFKVGPEPSNADVPPKPTTGNYWIELHAMKVRAALAAHCGYNISFDGQQYYCLGPERIGIDQDLSDAMDKALVPDYATDWDASHEAMISAMKHCPCGLKVVLENMFNTPLQISLDFALSRKSLSQHIDVILDDEIIFQIDRIDPDAQARVALFIFEGIDHD